MQNIHNKYVFILALVVVHLLFFLFALQSGHIYLTNDSQEYLNQAVNLRLNHTWYAGNMNAPLDDFFYSRRPPLTGFFIMLIKWFCNSDFAVCFVQCVLSIFNILLVIKCIRIFLPQWKNYLGILCLLLFFPTQMIYANMIMAEIIFQTMLVCAFYFLLKCITQESGHYFLLTNCCLALAILAKPVLYLFWPLWLLYTGFLLLKKKINIRTAIVAFILPLLILAISYRNYTLTNVFQYSSVQENHVINFSVRNAIQAEKGRAVADSIVFNTIVKAKEKSTYKDYHDYLMQENYQLLQEYKASFLLLSLKGCVQFFTDPGRWDLYSFFYEIPPENPDGMMHYFKQQGIKGALYYVRTFPLPLVIYLLLCCIVNIILLGTFFFFLADKNIAVLIRLISFLLVMYLVFVTGLMGSARYRMAVYPILLFAFFLTVDKIKTISLKK